MSEPKVSLVGAGLVGCLLAIMLSKRGYVVNVFEKRADPRLASRQEGRSINLALAVRGLHGLDQAGVLNSIMPLTSPVRGRMVHRLDGGQDFQAYGIQSHEINYSISRSDLNISLLELAAAQKNVFFHFNYTLKEIDFSQRIATFQSNDKFCEHSYELLIGADGAHSVVRKNLERQAGLQCDYQPLSHGYKELLLPTDDMGQAVFRQDALHIWPQGDYMLMALPNLDRSFTLTLYLPYEGQDSFEQLTSQASIQSFFQQKFPNVLPYLPDLAQAFLANPIGQLGTVKSSPWHFQNSVLLIGDAAHAIVPFHAQGINCGFEDCAELMQLLDQKHSLADCLAPFYQQRKPNTDAIAEMALENYIEMRQSVNDPLYLLKRQVARVLAQKFPEQFIPRYAMVMYHRIPYQEALERGRKQSILLDKICHDKQSIDQINLDAITVDLSALI